MVEGKGSASFGRNMGYQRPDSGVMAWWWIATEVAGILQRVELLGRGKGKWKWI